VRLLRAYNWLLPLTVALGVLAYGVAEENLAIFVVAAPIILAARLLSPPLRPQAVFPQWVVYIAVVAATVWTFLSWSRAGVSDSIVVLSRYLVALQLIKLFDNRGARDHLQIIALSAILVVGACLTSVNADLGAVLVLYLPVAIATAVNFQLFAASRPQGRTEPLPVPAVEQGASAQLRRMIVAPTLFIIAIASVVFVATPRLDVAIQFLPWTPKPRQAATLDNQIKLGEQGILSDSRIVVMTMKVESEQDPAASGRAWRLRSSVLDEYDFDARLWRSSSAVRPSLSDRESYNSWKSRPEVPDIPARSTVYEFTVTVHQASMSRLYAPWRPLSFEAVTDPPVKGFRFNRTSGVAEMVRSDIMLEPFTYIVRTTPYLADAEKSERSDRGDWNFEELRWSHPVWLSDGWPMAQTPDEWRRSRSRYVRERLPTASRPRSFDASRVAQLANYILDQRGVALNESDPDSAERAVNALKKYLEDNFIYTNEMVSPVPGQDPIDMFLFDSDRGGRGHCEYFAAGLAAMCQSIGIPARVVLGYFASEYDSLSKVYTVRGSDAHAWIEAEIRPGVWREFDPSPSAAVLRATEESLPVVFYLRRAIDYLQFAWVRSIVAFDRDSQAVTLQSVGKGPINALQQANNWISENLVDRPQEIAQRSPAVAAMRTFLWVIAVATGAGLLLLLVINRGPRLLRALRAWFVGAPLSGPAASADPIVRDYAALYERLLQGARAIGYRRPLGATPLAVASALRGRDPALADRAESFADLYYRARFAADPDAGERLADARRLVAEAVERARAIARGEAEAE